jgi:hypothetical protein
MKKEKGVKGVKVSRDLAITNITSRQSFKNQLELFTEYDTEADNKLEELKKSLFTLSEQEQIIYDGLCPSVQMFLTWSIQTGFLK